MQILNEQDIINVMNGAALLAAGGGGCFDDGMILLESFKKNHPNKPLTVRLVDVSELEDGACAAVVAGMGAPTKGAGKDFTPCAVDAFAEVQRMAAEMGKGVHYTMPVEMGAFNTFVPMLISLMTGLPTLDADAAGRAVPLYRGWIRCFRISTAAPQAHWRWPTTMATSPTFAAPIPMTR